MGSRCLVICDDPVMPPLQGLGVNDDLIQGWRDFVAYPWLFYFTPSA